MSDKIEYFRQKIAAFMKKVVSRPVSRIKSYATEQLHDTDKGVYYLLLIVVFIYCGCASLDLGIPKWIAFLVCGTICAVICALVIKIASFLVKKLYKIINFIGIKETLVMVLLFGFIYSFLIYACMDFVSEAAGTVASVLVFLIAFLFVKSFYAIFFNKKKNKSLLGICFVSGVLFIGALFLLLGEGFEDSYIKEYVALYEKNEARQIGLMDEEDLILREEQIQSFGNQLQKGSLQVGVIDYGMSEKRIQPSDTKDVVSLESESFDLSDYVGGYEGIEAAYRTWYQGYDIKNVPLAGRIWYPKEVMNCPVLFIIHGNHTFTTESYLGYEYLGEYLASHGYVVVSVDENVCNGNVFGNLTEENDGRAVLLLENIRQVFSYNKEEENPLYNKIDETNIALAGHSRGGEAAATAAYFNTLSNYPENGRIRFHYQFDIKSVIAIAPTADQYKPVDRSVTLEDVNYLLVHGANDQDVSIFRGLTQYNNVDFTREKACFKSYLYIAGANHGQFNSVWGKYDTSLPFSKALNVENLLMESEQQDILKIFTKEFLDVTLLGEKEHKDLFYNVQKYQAKLPKTVYIQGYADSSYDYVCNFEEDIDLTTTTMEGGSLEVLNVSEWTEKLALFSSGGSSSNKGDYKLYAQWQKGQNASVVINIPSYNAKDKNISLEIQDMYNADVKKEDYELLSAKIVLTDSDYKEAEVNVKDYYTIYPPLPVRLSKLQFLFKENEYKHQLQTVTIPVSEFTKEEGFDESDIVKIRIILDNGDRGKVRIDDIAFANETEE